MPYLLWGKRGKNDAADAAAICEALQHLEDLPGWANTAVGDCLGELHHLDERIAL